MKRHEGYLLIENRHAPGPTEAMVAEIRKTGQPFVNPDVPVFETATLTCAHCQQIAVINNKRTRPRGYCAGCHHYICDGCAFIALTAPVHTSIVQQIDEARNAAARSLAISEI